MKNDPAAKRKKTEPSRRPRDKAEEFIATTAPCELPPADRAPDADAEWWWPHDREGVDD